VWKRTWAQNWAWSVVPTMKIKCCHGNGVIFTQNPTCFWRHFVDWTKYRSRSSSYYTAQWSEWYMCRVRRHCVAKASKAIGVVWFFPIGHNVTWSYLHSPDVKFFKTILLRFHINAASVRKFVIFFTSIWFTDTHRYGGDVYSAWMLEDMKIFVCFGSTKIVVPCGSELPVRELVQQAIVRYRKVTNKVSIPKLNSLIVSFVMTKLKC
jgi:hypothetical protein